MKDGVGECLCLGDDCACGAAGQTKPGSDVGWAIKPADTALRAAEFVQEGSSSSRPAPAPRAHPGGAREDLKSEEAGAENQIPGSAARSSTTTFESAKPAGTDVKITTTRQS